MSRVVDLFAGPGGWSEGMASLGIREVGLELDRDACLTRIAAGHRTVRTDVAAYPPDVFAGFDGLVASPPCQAFSQAGKREGINDLPRIHAAIERCRSGWTDEVRAGPWADDRSPLILEPLRWAWAVRPTWIACEQVPPALGVWEHMADVLRGWGYDARALRLLAADYGVPQTRLRAFLLAHRERVHVAEPTHAEKPEPGLFGDRKPWVSMAEALGWDTETPRTCRNYFDYDPKPHAGGGASVPTFDPNNRPARVLTHRVGGWTVTALDRRVGGYAEDAEPVTVDRPAPTLTLSNGRETWMATRPATTVAGSFAAGRVAPPGHHDLSTYEDGAVSIELHEAAILQGFRPDYPFQGTKTSRFRQVGNAVPPTWAAQIIAALRSAA